MRTGAVPRSRCTSVRVGGIVRRQSPSASDAAPDASATTAPDANVITAPYAPVTTRRTRRPTATTGDARPYRCHRARASAGLGAFAVPPSGAADSLRGRGCQGETHGVRARRRRRGRRVREGKESGARVIVGPLVRDDMKTLAAAGLELPPTIALNQLDEGTTLPRTCTRSPSRSTARRGSSPPRREDGAMTVAVIAATQHGSSASRLHSMPNGYSPAAGSGDVPVRPRAGCLRLMRRELVKAPVDAVLLAVDATDAALVKLMSARSELHQQPGQRTPASGNPARSRQRALCRHAVARRCRRGRVRGAQRPDYPNATSTGSTRSAWTPSRRAGVRGRFAAKLEFDGATGHLSLDSTRQFVREDG